jgi:precorrin-6Y C5,15-methyltransferase (decarboxylating)
VSAWLTVIGIGDDGVAGLGPEARALLEGAELLVGGERHQAMVAQTNARRLTWAGGVHHAAREIARWRGRPVVVLATGDPMWFGGGANLARRFGAGEMRVLPFPGAFSMTAARMLWPMADIVPLNLHSRPLAQLNLHVQPRARLIALCRDGATPLEAARLMTARGFGPSPMTVFEHLGGARERRLDGTADAWPNPRCADLCTLAVICVPGEGANVLPAAPGLSDEAFEHDGQLTKREVRAQTVSALAPGPGLVLWDVGAGCGSVAIEWLRCAPSYRIDGGGEARAFAIERDGGRCAAIARNAEALGVPALSVVLGAAPDALQDLAPPDRVFVGGGASGRGLLEACWNALRPGGLLVANAVTIEGFGALERMRVQQGGDLRRIAVSRAGPVGKLSAFRALMEVTQWEATKA